jgi:predicted acyltransferase
LSKFLSIEVCWLIPSRPDGLAGVLTDGYRFDFFYLKPKGHQSRRRKSAVETEEELVLYESAAIYATDKSSIDHIMGTVPLIAHLILGLFTRFSQGYTPESYSSIRFVENT